VIKKIIGGVLLMLLTPPAVAGAGYLYARYVEPSFLDVSVVRVNTGFTGGKTMRIVAFGDTHVGNGLEAAGLGRVVRRINGLKPDVILFLGDLFENYEQYGGNPEDILFELSALAGKKYAIYGNHDLGGKAKKAYGQVMAGSGFTILCNRSVLVSDKINLIGLDDMIFGKPDLSGLTLSGCFNVLAVHEPDYGLQDTGADLQISGHTHGGQVVIPFLWQQMLPSYGVEFTRGMYQKEDGGLLYVNRGIGTSMVRLRLFSPPEITAFDLSY